MMEGWLDSETDSCREREKRWQRDGRKDREREGGLTNSVILLVFDCLLIIVCKSFVF